MSPPRITGPRDVPELRAWIAERWRPGGVFHQLSALGFLGEQIPTWDPRNRHAVLTAVADWQSEILAESALWWIAADMVDLIDHAAQDLPPVDYHDGLCPADPAFVVFERPLTGHDAQNPEATISVDALSWSTSRGLAPSGPGLPRRPGITVMAYSRATPDEVFDPANYPEQMDLAERMGLPMPPRPVNATDSWVPLGRTDWATGADWDEPIVPGLPETAHASMAEDRRWLAAMWALASQRNVVDLSDQHAARPTARRAQRARYRTSTVTVVNLRRSLYEGAEREPVDTPSGRTYRVRWPVKGHWRNQAYGPGRAYRRPTYIAPFIKGPLGAPLKQGATVHVLKEQQ